MGGFSDVNLKLAFDSQVLLPKHQRHEMKLIYKIKTGDSTSQNNRISTKILKQSIWKCHDKAAAFWLH